MFECKPYCGKQFEKESSFKGHQTRTRHNLEIGFFWHVHHSVTTAEWCYDYSERVNVIKTLKPYNEQEIRLRWFTPVQGKIPESLVAAGKAWSKANDLAKKANEAYREIPVVLPGKSPAAKNAAHVQLRKANVVCDRARDLLAIELDKAREEIDLLHAKEHPGCPWNAKQRTIFPVVRT